MKKFLRRMIGIVGFAALAGMAAWIFLQQHGAARADEGDNGKSHVQAPAHVSTANGHPTIKLTQDALSHSGIKTVALENIASAETLRVYGSVLNLQSLTDLADKYATAKANIETEQAKRDLAHATLVRARALYGQGPRAISQAQVETAEADYRISKAKLAAAHAQLQTLAHTALQAWGTVLGRAISQSQPLLTQLINRRDVLIQVTLGANDALAQTPKSAFVRQGRATPIGLRFISLAPMTDPRFQGESFYFAAAAASGLLPGMNVVAYVPTGHTVVRAKVPANAIVWVQGRAWAYFRAGPLTFVRRQIATNSPAPDGGYYVQNLRDGAQVVTRGAQMLLSEEFRAQIETED